MKTTNVGCHILVVTTHLLAKAKMCCFIYSLFVPIMYIIVNKVTFTGFGIIIICFVILITYIIFNEKRYKKIKEKNNI